MLKKFSPLAICLSLLTLMMYFAMPSAVMAAGVAFHNIEMPCHEQGQKVQACVVIHKTLSGKEAIDHETFSLAPAADLKGRAQVFSVIYIYHTMPSAFNGVATVSVEHNDDGYMSDVHVGQPGMFWMTTHDGGRTFSKISSNLSGGLSM